MVNQAIRNAIGSLYSGKCTITQHQKVFNYVTKTTSLEEVVLCEDEPCRLSHMTIGAADNTDTVAKIVQTIKLFIRPEIIIPAGSKIEVSQNGRVKKYIASGESAVYSNHQEVVLEIARDKA